MFRRVYIVDHYNLTYACQVIIINIYRNIAYQHQGGKIHLLVFSRNGLHTILTGYILDLAKECLDKYLVSERVLSTWVN